MQKELLKEIACHSFNKKSLDLEVILKPAPRVIISNKLLIQLQQKATKFQRFRNNSSLILVEIKDIIISSNRQPAKKPQLFSSLIIKLLQYPTITLLWLPLLLTPRQQLT